MQKIDKHQYIHFGNPATRGVGRGHRSIAGSGGASGSGGAGEDNADMPAGSGDAADNVVVGDFDLPFSSRALKLLPANALRNYRCPKFEVQVSMQSTPKKV